MRSSRGGLVGRGCAGNSLIPSSNHEYERIILYFRSSRKVSFFPYRIFCGIFSLNIISTADEGDEEFFKKINNPDSVMMTRCESNLFENERLKKNLIKDVY